MNYLNINTEQTLPVAKELNQLLADYHIYYQKLKNFHWNVTGKNFFDLHTQFEELYKDARVKIDEIAERILTLRYHPVSKFSVYLKISQIQEESTLQTDEEMVLTILEDHKTILQQMTKIINKSSLAKDEGTIDLIGGYIGELEKKSWMLNAWSKKTENQLMETFVV